MTVHANSLANLAPAWQPGESGNRAGRKPIGLSMLEWANELDATNADGTAKYDDDALAEIVADRKAQHSKRFAAQVLIDGHKGGFTDNGKPYALELYNLLYDRSVGKPVQSVIMHHTQPDDPEVLLAELRAAITRSPELLSLIGDRLPPEALPAVPAAPDESAGHESDSKPD